MTKPRAAFFIITAVFLSLLANVFFGRWLSAKLSTWPLLNRWNILSPQTPIVINNQEVVHTSESTDFLSAVNSAKSHLATVAGMDSAGNIAVAGSAVNMTSDGVFVTGSSTFAPGIKYFVSLNDGTSAPVSTTTADAATGLVFFKADLSDVSPAVLGTSSQLLPGDKILFLENSLQSFMPRFSASFITTAQDDVQGTLFDADAPSRSFGAQPTGTATSVGEAVVNLNGEVVGIWNGARIISADVLEQATNLYLTNPQKIIHPIFGFTYTMLTKDESGLAGLPEGALVKNVKSKIAGGLQAGDIIMAVDGTSINEDDTLEPVLQKYKPGDSAMFTVQRNKQTVTVVIKIQPNT